MMFKDDTSQISVQCLVRISWLSTMSEWCLVMVLQLVTSLIMWMQYFLFSSPNFGFSTTKKQSPCLPSSGMPSAQGGIFPSWMLICPSMLPVPSLNSSMLERGSRRKDSRRPTMEMVWKFWPWNCESSVSSFWIWWMVMGMMALSLTGFCSLRSDIMVSEGQYQLCPRNPILFPTLPSLPLQSHMATLNIASLPPALLLQLLIASPALPFIQGASLALDTSTLLLQLNNYRCSQPDQLDILKKCCESEEAVIDMKIIAEYFWKSRNLDLSLSFLLRLYQEVLTTEKMDDVVEVFVRQGEQQIRSMMGFMLGEQTECFLSSPSNRSFLNIKSFLQKASPQQVQEFSSNFVQKYLKTWVPRWSQTPNINIFYHFKMLELVHLAHPALNISYLLTADQFLQGPLYKCLCDFQTNGACALAANIYGGILKELGVYDQFIQSFFDVYLILDCFGAHLVRDVWSNFYVIAAGVREAKDKYLFPVWKLLHCLLAKVESHTNNNVSKYCIQSLLTADLAVTASLFECLPNTVYGSLIQILNSGTHYHDCSFFHEDSKWYTVIQSFYTTYYSSLQGQPAQLKTHIERLLNAMNRVITFEHCIVAYIGILPLLPPVPSIIQAPSLGLLAQIVNRLYRKLTIRKRHTLINSIFACLSANLEPVTLQVFMRDFVMLLPIEVVSHTPLRSQSTKPFLYSLLETKFTHQHIRQYLKRENQLRDDSPAQYSENSVLMLESLLAFSSPYHHKSLTLTTLKYQLPYLAQAQPPSPQLNHKAIAIIARVISYGGEAHMLEYMSENPDVIDWLLVVMSHCICEPECHPHIKACIEMVCKGMQVSRGDSSTCRSFTKFIEYCMSKCMEGEAGSLPILIEAIKQKQIHTKKYLAIEECFYNLYSMVVQNQLRGASPKDSLRIEIILLNILSHDTQFFHSLLADNPHYVEGLAEVSDIYDFEHYEELFQFISIVCTHYQAVCQKSSQPDKWTQFANSFCKSGLRDTIDGMLCNLDYGVQTKEVVSSTACVLHVAGLCQYDQPSVSLIEHLLKIGERYWGFQRQTIFGILQHFRVSADTQQLPVFPPGLRSLIPKMASVEEYRGHDSAILLDHHCSSPIYSENLVSELADYDGTSLRLSVIYYAESVLQLLLSKEEGEAHELWMGIFDDCLGVCSNEVVRERMFLTGSHKEKLKLWQLMLVYPQFLLQFHPDVRGIITTCFTTMSHNNLAEVRHYSEIFMMKMITLSKDPQITSALSQALTQQLLSIYGQTNLNKNISYMLLGGLVLQQQYHHGLYTAMFVSVCSHIGYYRGISQYFCYKLIGTARQHQEKDLEYIESLYLEYCRDEDAVNLTGLLNGIVEEYKKLIRSWNIRDNLLGERATLNGQIISSSYYVEELKLIGQKLVKTNKAEDGFVLAKDAWKRLANISKQAEDDEKKEASSFQRKIDPSLDDLYSYRPLQEDPLRFPNTRIIVISAEKIALYGHLARVSEIMGVKELCIPNKSITSEEDFYNVSVTAENWLNITEHRFEKARPAQPIRQSKTKNPKQKQQQQPVEADRYSGKECLHGILRNFMSQGYAIHALKKGAKHQLKSCESFEAHYSSVLVIDELDLLGQELDVYVEAGRQISFGEMYSSHVEATIFIWETFKRFASS